MALTRRRFVSLGGLALAMLAPLRAFAAWPKAAFDAKTSQEAIEVLLGGRPEPSPLVQLVAPEIAENGGVVPITVQTDLQHVESVSVIAEENPRPLVGTFRFGKFTTPPVSIRIKLGKTQNVVAVVKARGKLYSATRTIKVTVGGCGG